MSEDQLESLRACLNRDNIKLWLAPFTQDNSEGNYSQEMLNKYSKELNIPLDKVTSLLEKLRQKAIGKLQAIKEFKSSGIATLRAKVTSSGQQAEHIEVKTKLEVTGAELKHQIANQLSIKDPSYLKIISSGRVLQEFSTLISQNVKNNAHLLVLVLQEKERNQILESENQFSKLEEVKRMANLLSAGSDNFMQVADQKGQTLDMPASERQALSIALTLHEKGRGSLKLKNYSEALIFFIEADEAFKNCNASILSRVDNYAVLCLDIAWCYLCLQSFSQLPDADQRLKMCEEGFYKSYGPNLERLTQVKGDTSSERALFVRLHLLQAVVAYYNNNIIHSCSLLKKAEEALKTLKVDDELLAQVMSMGFEKTESRIALRRAKGNVQIAMNFIMSQHEEKARLKEKEKEKAKQKKLEKKLGKTNMGKKVNISAYMSLVQMGFNKEKVIEALKLTENDIDQAVVCLSEQKIADSIKFQENLVKLESLGMNAAEAKAMLEKFDGDYDKLITHLTNPLSSSTSSSSSTSASSSSSEPDLLALANTLAEELPNSIEDHLDISLEEEEGFLNHYKNLIEK